MIDIKPYKKVIVSVVNLLLLTALFTISFIGSMISLATVEMAEAETMLQQEIELIKKDSSRISWIRITVDANGKQIPKDCENQIVVDQYTKQKKIRYFLGIVPFIKNIDFLNLPDKVILLISATFMGLLGSLITLVKESTYDQLKLNPEIILKHAALGFTSGLLVIVLSYVLPSIITLDSDVKVRIETLTTFSLLAGMFFRNLVDKISQKVN